MQFQLAVFLSSLHWSIRQRLSAHFVILWLFVLILTVMYGLWACDNRASALPAQHASEARCGRGLCGFSLTDGIAVAIFILFVTFYILLILYKEDFAYYDDDMLTDFSLRGIAFPAPIWPGPGRFFPLADQGFNLLGYFTRSPFSYHFSVVIELVLLLVVLFIALREIRLVYRLLILAVIMLAPSFVIPFGGFVYPERSVLLWLGVLLLCLRGHAKTGARLFGVGCLVATQFALYYKETVVVFIVAYASTSLLLEAYLEYRRGQHSWRAVAREQSIQLGMLGLAGIYTVLFVILIFSQSRFSYVHAVAREGILATLFAYFRLDWFLVIFFVVIAVRLGLLFLAKSAIEPMWDSLAVGAAAYAVCIINLRIYSAYYMAPADLIALLYVAHLALSWLQGTKKSRVFAAAAVAAVFICLVLHRGMYSAFRILERKDVIVTKSDLAAFLKTYRPAAKDSVVVVYFPYADGYRLMELSSYLRYKGLPVVGPENTQAKAGRKIVIEGPAEFKGNRCVDYRDYACFHAEGAEPGALIVVLPDDDASMEDVAALGQKANRLWSVKECSYCSGENRWFRRLRGISASHARGELPGHWLQLDIFEKPA